MALNILWRFAEPYWQAGQKSKPTPIRIPVGLMRLCNGPKRPVQAA